MSNLTTIVICLALLIYGVMDARVGSARVKYRIPAPATTGHPPFEWAFRIQAARFTRRRRPAIPSDRKVGLLTRRAGKYGNRLGQFAPRAIGLQSIFQSNASGG